MKRIAILQSNYIPWKGNFDMIHMVDEFVLYDDMQYTKRDWRNRNRIKTPTGLQWLTIPVCTKGKFKQKINETEVLSSKWVDEHLRAICCNYAKADCFLEYFPSIRELYNQCKDEKFLSNINYIFLKGICELLGIDTKITKSSDYIMGGGRTEQLVNICLQAGANEYLSGPAAKSYIDDNIFREADIQLCWMDYANYPEYAQLYGTFIHEVTILDMLMNVGEKARQYMKSFAE